MRSPRTTPERDALAARILRPLRRPTLVETLRRDIDRSAAAGPDWPTVVEDAVLRQDMEWIEESLVPLEQTADRALGWSRR